MVQQLSGFGVVAVGGDDDITVTGARSFKPWVVECYDDHRVAMSFSVFACAMGGAVITEKRCVEKTVCFFNSVAWMVGYLAVVWSWYKRC